MYKIPVLVPLQTRIWKISREFPMQVGALLLCTVVSEVQKTEPWFADDWESFDVCTYNPYSFLYTRQYSHLPRFYPQKILVLRILLRWHMELFIGNSLGHKSAECRMMKFCAGGSNWKTWQPSTTNDVMPDASFAVPSHVTPICICPLDLWCPGMQIDKISFCRVLTIPRALKLWGHLHLRIFWCTELKHF